MREPKFEFIENCLLHLYISISMNGGHHSVAKRNKILAAYLKPKVKLTKFKFIKSEIKSMLAIAKNKDGDLENNLVDFYNKSLKYCDNVENSDLDTMLEMLQSLFVDHQIDSKLLNDSLPIEDDCIYMETISIEENFDKHSRLIEPLQIMIRTTRLNEVRSLIASLWPYEVQFFEQNEQSLIILLPAKEL